MIFSRFLCFSVALAATLAISACNKKDKDPLRKWIDPTFSMNVVPVPMDWPKEERDWHDTPRIAAYQQRLYEEKGAPDYFYLYWRRDGKPLTAREFTMDSWVHRNDEDRSPMNNLPDRGWIYLDDDAIYRFQRNGPEKKPLPDTIRLITEYGDPHEIKESTDPAGQPHTIYQYYDEGKIFYFREGKKYKEQNTQRMEGFLERR